MTPGISNFAFPVPLAGEISVARLQANTVNRLGWELVAVFNEQHNGEIQAFGIFRRSTDAAFQAALASLEEKQKALEAKEAAFAEDRKTFDAVVEAGKQMEEKILALGQKNTELSKLAVISKDIESKLRVANAELGANKEKLEKDLKESNREFVRVKESELNYSTQLNALKLAHKALEEKYAGWSKRDQAILESEQRKIKKLKKELRGYKKPVMKGAVKTPAKPAEKYRKKK